MSSVTVFDPAMCCSSGVCGPKPDQKLAAFSADLQFLESLGHSVTRHNLAQEPATFAANLTVKTLLETHKSEALPVILKDGALVSYGCYPDRNKLESMINGEPLAAETENTATESSSCGCQGGC